MPERVYLPQGTVAHVLPWDGSPNNPSQDSLCGRAPWPGDWLGSGTQDEHEKAAALPLCVSCGSVVRHQAGGKL